MVRRPVTIETIACDRCGVGGIDEGTHCVRCNRDICVRCSGTELTNLDVLTTNRVPREAVLCVDCTRAFHTWLANAPAAGELQVVVAKER